MKEKIKVSAVNYLNSKPFIYGLESSSVMDEIELQLDVPSDCADKLLNGKVDIGLVPVVTLPQLKESHIISDYCIGADGKVDSVLIAGRYPLDQVETLRLVSESRTSVMLAKILLEKWWKLNPDFADTPPAGDERKIFFSSLTRIKYTSVMIGDMALIIKDCVPHTYDLAEEWKKFTGLPFVFACWVANKKLDDGFLKRFNKALKKGLDNKLIVAANELKTPYYPGVDITDYLTNKISYEFDDRKKEALKLFLNYVESYLETEKSKVAYHVM